MIQQSLIHPNKLISEYNENQFKVARNSDILNQQQELAKLSSNQENEHTINMFYLKDILLKDIDHSNDNQNSLQITSYG